MEIMDVQIMEIWESGTGVISGFVNVWATTNEKLIIIHHQFNSIQFKILPFCPIYWSNFVTNSFTSAYKALYSSIPRLPTVSAS